MSWTRWSIVGILLYLIAGAASGLLGWWFGTWANWQPEGDLLRGLAWGTFGAAVVRVHFSSIPAEGSGEAITLLGGVSAWLLGGIDWGVQRAAGKRLQALDDHLMLIQFAGFVWEAGPEVDKNLEEPVRIVESQQLRDLVAAIADGPADARALAVGSLSAKVARWVVKYGVSPPVIH